eukprot:scaffold4782_cov106-Cylindrotheca_fusiformis.AAC.6
MSNHPQSNHPPPPAIDIDSLLRQYLVTLGNGSNNHSSNNNVRSTAAHSSSNNNHSNNNHGNSSLHDTIMRPPMRTTSSLTNDNSSAPSLADTSSSTTTSSLSDSTALQNSLTDSALRGLLQGPSNGLTDAIRKAAIEAVKQHHQQQQQQIQQQQQLLQLIPDAASAISRLSNAASNSGNSTSSFLQAQPPSAVTNLLNQLQNANVLLALQTLASASGTSLPNILFNSDPPPSTSSISSGYSSASSGSSGGGRKPASVASLDSNLTAQSNQNFLTQAALEVLAAQLLSEATRNKQNNNGTSNSSSSTEDDTLSGSTIDNGGARKKQKLSPKDAGGGDASHDYQEEKWDTQFKELLAFKAKFGHCRVPQNYEDNPALSHWVKRQRYQHKCKREGKVSSMSESRIQKLEQIGFVWDAQELLWHTRFEELKEYRVKHGHCNVPYNYDLNRKLPTWIKCQRRQYKLLKEGQPSNMTQERIDLLQGLGFKWGQRESTVAER